MLSICRMEFAKPTQIFMMAQTQSLDASVSSLMIVGFVAKSVAVAEVCSCLLLPDCT